MTTRTHWHVSRFDFAGTLGDWAMLLLFVMGIAGWGIVGISVINWAATAIAAWWWR